MTACHKAGGSLECSPSTACVVSRQYECAVKVRYKIQNRLLLRARTFCCHSKLWKDSCDVLPEPVWSKMSRLVPFQVHPGWGFCYSLSRHVVGLKAEPCSSNAYFLQIFLFLFVLAVVCDSIREAAMLNVSILPAVNVEWWLPVLRNCCNFCPCSFVSDTPSMHRVGVICNVLGGQSVDTLAKFSWAVAVEKRGASWSCVKSNLNRSFFLFFPILCAWASFYALHVSLGSMLPAWKLSKMAKLGLFCYWKGWGFFLS